MITYTILKCTWPGYLCAGLRTLPRLCGVTWVSPSTISELNKKVYGRIDEWRSRPLDKEYPYVYLDGLYLKRSWGGEIRQVSILVAIAVGIDGHREILGVTEGAKEDKEGLLDFLRHLKTRGLKGVKLFVSDKCLGLVEALADIYPDSLWQRCVVHFYHNVFTVVPNKMIGQVVAMLKAIHAQEDRESAKRKAQLVIENLQEMKLPKAADKVREAISDILTYMSFPREHWVRIRTNNTLERLMREIRRRTNVVGCFPDGKAALMLAAARLRHVAGSLWSTRIYLNMDLLKDMELEAKAA